jgi:hypothetical protein
MDLITASGLVDDTHSRHAPTLFALLLLPAQQAELDWHKNFITMNAVQQ